MATIADELIAILGYETEGEDEAKRYKKTIQGLGDDLNNLAKEAGKFAAIAAGVLATGFGFLGKSVVDTSAQFESYAATLKTIEGSAEAAEAALDWVAEFGKTTPYDVAQVTEAFVRLKSQGVDPIADDALRTLGDTASAMGKDLIQAVEAFTDASTGEFERLKEFGIRASSAGDQVTFSWTKNGESLQRTVKKNSEEIRAFLLETMGDRFGGAMDEQSRTWRGMMSNLGDSWVDFQRRVGDQGFFETVKSGLQSLLDTIARLDADGTLDEWASAVSSALTSAYNAIVFLAERGASNIAFLAENFDELRPFIIGAGIAVAFLVARAFPLITVISVLGLVIDDLIAYLQGGESMIGDFVEALQDMFGVSREVAEWFTGLAGIVGAALTSAFVFSPGKTLKLFGRLMLSGLAAAAPLIGKGIIAALALLATPAGWAILLAGAAAGLIYYFWDDIKAAWDTVVEMAPDVFSTLLDGILLTNPFLWGVKLIMLLWDGLKSKKDDILEWFSSLVPSWFNESMDPGMMPHPGFDMNTSGANFTPQNFNSNAARVDNTVSAGSLLGHDRAAPGSVVDVTVNQTVTRASDAPGAAARATGDALAGQFGGATSRRVTVEREPVQP